MSLYMSVFMSGHSPRKRCRSEPSKAIDKLLQLRGKVVERDHACDGICGVVYGREKRGEVDHACEQREKR